MDYLGQIFNSTYSQYVKVPIVYIFAKHTYSFQRSLRDTKIQYKIWHTFNKYFLNGHPQTLFCIILSLQTNITIFTTNIFLNGHPQTLFVLFHLFKQILQFLQQICIKNVHLVYDAGI